MNKILIICGQTATGKTNIALYLTKVLPAEIISADSRQVYKGMDIGTGKDKPKNIKIWGYDLVDPDEDFSVAHFYQYTWKLIKKFWSQKKLPTIVGGTGQYLETIDQPPDSLNIVPNPKLRASLQKLSVAELQEKLSAVNPTRLKHMNRSDRHNPRRLVRAIEITLTAPKQQVFFQEPKANFLRIGLKADIETIDKNIHDRVLERVNQGMTQEVNKLLKKYPTWDYPAFSATGYRLWHLYLQGNLSKEQAIALWVTQERQYARRQMTWFKKQPGINWFDITKNNWQVALVDKVKNWYASTQ